MVLVAVASFVATGYMGQYLRAEFIPLEDQSEFNVKVKARLGSSINTTDMLLESVRQRLKDQPWWTTSSLRSAQTNCNA